jgi:hypothetical protein
VQELREHEGVDVELEGDDLFVVERLQRTEQEFISAGMPLATRCFTMRSMFTSVDQSRSLAFQASVLPSRRS